jgi:hypothetical protein
MGACPSAAAPAAKPAAKPSAAPSKCSCVADAKTYAISFAGGLTSGVTGELFTLIQNGKLSVTSITAPAFSDAVFLSGVQQIAKDFSKATLKRSPTFAKLSTEHPFLFGAATGLPMWGLTRIVGTPLQNSRKKDVPLYSGLTKSVVDDVGYHTIKNGLDELVSVACLSKLIPTLPNFATQRLVEALASGAVGSATYVLAWPYKTAVAGQALPDAVALAIKNAPKIAIKKATYSIARPSYAKLLA